MATIRMTSRTLSVLKGWPITAGLDFSAQYDSTVTDVMPPGTVVRLNSSGKFLVGVGNNKVMPLITFKASDDPSVVPASNGDPSTTYGVFVGGTPQGAVMAYPVTSGLELLSTNYVSDTYAPNDPLTSATSGGNAGKLAKGTMYTNMIVGIVSRGVINNGWETPALAFWTHPVFPTA